MPITVGAISNVNESPNGDRMRTINRGQTLMTSGEKSPIRNEQGEEDRATPDAIKVEARGTSEKKKAQIEHNTIT